MQALVLGCLVVLFSWSPAQPVLPQTVLRTYSGYAPQTLDPQGSNDSGHFRFFAQIFESPLEMDIDEKGRCQIRAAICQYPRVSDDGLTLAFPVQAGIRFHDDPCFPEGKGREVTAKDIVFSLMRIADPAYANAFWEPFLAHRIKGLDAWREGAVSDGLADYDAPVAGLVAEDGLLTITLVRPYPQILGLLTQPWASVLPREAISHYGSGFGSRPIGTGPFLFSDIDALGTLTVTKNPHYRIPGRPLVDAVRFHVIPSLEDRTKRFLDGTLDILDVWPDNVDELLDRRGNVKSVLARKGIKVVEGINLDVSYFAFNFKNKLLAEPAIRQAIALGFDRGTFARRFNGSDAHIADSPLPPPFPESDHVERLVYRYAKPDLAKARKLLADAGYPGGQGLPEFVFDVLGGKTSDRMRAATEGLVSDLARVGIRVQLRHSESFYDLIPRVRSGDIQIIWVSWFADYPDAENFLILFVGGDDPMATSNYGSFANAEYDKLYARMKELYPGPARTQLIVDMIRIVQRELPWIPIFYPGRKSAVQKSISGFRENILNFSLRDVGVAR